MKHNIVDKYQYIGFFTKKMKYLSKEEDVIYMRQRRDQCLKKSITNINENWFAEKLISANIKFNRQRIMGYRIYDFFIGSIGCAIEIDGPEHDEKYDYYRDIYNYLRSGIVIIRVRNKNKKDANEAIEFIKSLEPWPQRRRALKIQGKGIHPVDLTNPNDAFWKN